MMLVKTATFIVCLLTAAAVAAQPVTVVSGNVVASGHSLTFENRDSQASLSDDGREIVFVRAPRSDPRNSSPYGSIFLIPATGGEPVEVLAKARIRGVTVEGFRTPTLIRSRKCILALGHYADTWALLLRIELGTNRIEIVDDRVLAYDYIIGGRYGSCLVVDKRPLKGSYGGEHWFMRCGAWENASQLRVPNGSILNFIVGSGGRPALPYQYD